VVFAHLTALLGLALVDALNPFSIAAHAFLLGTNRPQARGAVFIVGTFALYLAAGWLLLEGWLAILRRLLPMLPAWAVPSLEAAAGLACLGFAVHMLVTQNRGKAFSPPSNLGLRATFLFAVVSTASDLPTALPLFAAVNQIAALEQGALGQLAWLALYVAVYVSPLVLMSVVQAKLGPRAEGVFGRVRAGVDWAFARLLPPLLMLYGAALIADAIRRFIS
jgi:hypothetical protein